MNNIRTAKFPRELLEAATEFDQMAKDFDFENEYRRFDSHEHKRLQNQIEKMRGLCSKYVEPELERASAKE